MTDPDEPPADETSVLASLTGTRPQRRSSKRPATKPSRRAAPSASADSPQTSSSRPPPDPPPSARPGPPPPAQGFEANPTTGPVDPPTSTELLASVAQGATELVELGLAVGRRLARSLIDRLPRI